MNWQEKQRQELHALALEANAAIYRKNAKKNFWNGIRGLLSIIGGLLILGGLEGAIGNDNPSGLWGVALGIFFITIFNWEAISSFVWSFLREPYEILWSRCVRTLRKNGW
ncbi:MAG: hypothetical protein PHN74_01065 [Candidatus Pacebacteria bacterium]|nr:hypothetical protein [Candidatus Paceibacterota bacterium]